MAKDEVESEDDSEDEADVSMYEKEVGYVFCLFFFTAFMDRGSRIALKNLKPRSP